MKTAKWEVSPWVPTVSKVSAKRVAILSLGDGLFRSTSLLTDKTLKAVLTVHGSWSNVDQDYRVSFTRLWMEYGGMVLHEFHDFVFDRSTAHATDKDAYFKIIQGRAEAEIVSWLGSIMETVPSLQAPKKKRPKNVDAKKPKG